jgi:hypothetical protein
MNIKRVFVLFILTGIFGLVSSAQTKRDDKDPALDAALKEIQRPARAQVPDFK